MKQSSEVLVKIIVSATFTKTGTLKWADFFCRIFRENPADINLGNFQIWTHFLGEPW